jgi:hypothetical protein
MEAAAPGDDFIMLPAFAGRAAGPHENRLEDAARPHGREDVGNVRSLAGVTHIGLADGKVAKGDEFEFHG